MMSHKTAPANLPTSPCASFQTLWVRELHHVWFVTLNLPATRNALAPEMVHELMQVVHALHHNPLARALVLRGSQGFFCAGGNVGNFQQRLQDTQQASSSAADPAPHSSLLNPVAARNREFGYFMQSLNALPLPVLAVVEGAAMGGGFGLACVADIVLAAQDAKFSLTETSLGIIPAQIAPFVSQRLGLVTTRRLGLSAQRLHAQAALECGLVDAVAPDSEGLDALVAQWLTQIGRCAPQANRALKSLLNLIPQSQETLHPMHPPASTDHRAYDKLLDHAALEFARCMEHEGAQGIAAFRQKTPAPWHMEFTPQEVRDQAPPAP